MLTALYHVRLRLPLLALLAAIYYLVPWERTGVAAAIAGLPLGFVLLVWLPGAAVSRRIGVREPDGFSAIALHAACGLFVVMACGFAWALTGSSLVWFRYGLPLVAIALSLWMPSRETSRVDPVAAPSTRGERGAMAALGVALAALFLAVWITGPPIHYKADTMDHVGYVNEVATTGEAFPVSAFYRAPGSDGADLRKGVLHIFYGSLRAHYGVDPTQLFAFMSALLLVLWALAVYAAALEMFGGRFTAVLAAALFLIGYQGGLGNEFIRSAFYPNRFGAAFLVLFIAAALSYLRRPEAVTMIRCALLAFTAAAIHVQYVVFVGLATIIIMAWRTTSPAPSAAQHYRRVFTVGLVAFLAMLPYALFRFLSGYQRNDLHTQVQGGVYVWGDWFVLAPTQTWQWMGLVGLAALAAAVALWPRRKEVPGAGYTSAALITVLVVQFVPLLLTPLYKAFTYLVFRLDRMVPFYMLSAFVLVELFQRPRMERAGVWRGIAVALTLAGMAVGLAPLTGDSAFSPSRLSAERARSVVPWRTSLNEVSAAIGDSAVVASDPVTSYVFSAFTPHPVVCTLDQHAPPNDRLSEVRMLAARTILSPFTGVVDKLAMMHESGATHIVINNSLPPMVLDYWSMSPENARIVRNQLSRSEAFDQVAASGPLTVFRRNGNKARRNSPALTPPLTDRLPTGAGAIVGPPAGSAALVGADVVAPGKVSHGEKFEVVLFWKRLPGHVATDNYVTIIRCDRVDVDASAGRPLLPLGGKPFPKVTRKLVELMRGERYRFRSDHMMHDGFYGPDAWPDKGFIRQLTTVRVPGDIAAGSYHVRARLIPFAHVPNHSLRDFFYDDDVYHGVAVGRIEIGE